MRILSALFLVACGTVESQPPEAGAATQTEATTPRGLGEACALPNGECAPTGEVPGVCFPEQGSSMYGRCTFYCHLLSTRLDASRAALCREHGGECREYKPGGITVCHLN